MKCIPKLAQSVALNDMKNDGIVPLSASKVISELPVKGLIVNSKPKIGFKF